MFFSSLTLMRPVSRALKRHNLTLRTRIKRLARKQSASRVQ
ncbi:Transposase [Shigella dysenteriae 1617]|uniref:Transposase n=1 Tax=Shigella dysenteriae 1617 TaxID=754093 RepID=A0A0A6ZYJ5_SHIDY|nr:Transposase [Shigella dysenteriae 1617]